ncbi:hypothetical protein J2Z22_002666 [Paenibacillus forsythiae]|uniref:Uncharacterized protein n=1 Tax=Paenibacillus forsythiae TaxID=365616 RepID=A0ABU3H8S6_9BACL|nr:hypothetical protein [Paenibacillus forsythiae]MDT3427130.1 hypothetical protein [Paenibacillus forsythiae]
MASFDKTEADFTYERYVKMGGVSPEQDIPADDIPLAGTETAQSMSERAAGRVGVPTRSPVAVRDPKRAADAGLNGPGPGQGAPRGRQDRILGGPAHDRDELLHSDASLAAGAAGLIQGLIDYANDEWTAEDEIDPLEDIPDADDIQAGSRVDPATPPLDVMPGTDVLNGSTGEDE